MEYFIENTQDRVLRNLVKKLDEIGANTSFQGIWPTLWTHGYRYNGPDYAKELEEARNYLAFMDQLDKEASKRPIMNSNLTVNCFE